MNFNMGIGFLSIFGFLSALLQGAFYILAIIALVKYLKKS